MIATLVQFRLGRAITIDEAREAFSATAPKYQAVPGLLRKHYLLSKDGETAGGLYLWQSQADADRFYSDEWRGFIRERYQSEPMVVCFENPVVVDNEAGTIRADLPPRILRCIAEGPQT
ncbi:YdhR family protein [Sphaerotilus uruguayifluvii]|uniref:Monooxygenase n=1 Tax=Sphaerotilus uruguayifluvii TaxID=2735897 RepID=A0ABX2GA47_9BURK|nr:YdhR family protein [Leptothrix sp. C29]NRT58222.1 hypothetical protein [Leptothrix sp. C29]